VANKKRAQQNGLRGGGSSYRPSQSITVYCWLLFLYPGTYRDDFGEMTSGFCEARSELPLALAANISFYRREFCGLLLGTLCAHFDRLFGPAIPFWRSYLQPQFPFSRSTVLASSVAGDTLGSAWR
jgi:hypothetical protein